MSVIMHVDMDAFYASVELRYRPELRGLPVIVGGAGRGVVLSATYEARASGVRSGMSSTQARRLCPQATFISPDFDRYESASKGVFALFRTVTPFVEAGSIDEAFLDVTGSEPMWGSPERIGERLRALINDEQQITCSVGIGPTKFVAKLASKEAKPDGLCEVAADNVIGFLHPLPVERMWGVGEATAAKLHQLGLSTVADIAHTSRATLQRAFGPRQGAALADLSWGRDDRPIVVTEPERSVGSQQTFSRDIDDPVLIRREVLRLSERVSSRMRAAEVLGTVVVLSIRFADFTTISRSGTLTGPTDITDEIYGRASALLAKLGLQRARVRRVGVRVEKLVPADQAYQQPVLGAPEQGWRELEKAVDKAVHRFGSRAVKRAVLTAGDPNTSISTDQFEPG